MKKIAYTPSWRIMDGLNKLENFFNKGILHPSLYKYVINGEKNLVYIRLDKKIKINSVFSEDIISSLIINSIKSKNPIIISFKFKGYYHNFDVKNRSIFFNFISGLKKFKIPFLNKTYGGDEGSFEINFNNKIDSNLFSDFIKIILLPTVIFDFYNIGNYSLNIKADSNFDVKMKEINKQEIISKDYLFEINNDVSKDEILNFFNEVFKVKLKKLSDYIYITIKVKSSNDGKTGEILKEYGSIKEPVIEKFKF